MSQQKKQAPHALESLPPWVKVTASIVSFAVLLWAGMLQWQIQRGLNRLDLLADKVGSIDTRVAVIEERFPQPLAKELAPLTEQVQHLALEIAELRGAKSAPMPKMRSESSAP